MTVVPANKFRCGMTAGKILSRNVEMAVSAGAVGEDHDMIGRAQFRKRQITADRDVADETKPLVAGDLLVDCDDLLYLGVVGCNASAHQAEGRRQSIEHVHPG